MPLISVIIPAYNASQTIRETIETVFKQSFSDFELIVINDGSQDKTLDVLASIRDPRLKVFSYTNAGVSASRNRGLSHARGEFIAFLDADDLWTQDKLEAQLAALQENPQAAVAYSWTNIIDETGQFLRSGVHNSISGDVYEELLLNNFLQSGSNPMIRRQALCEVGGFDESLAYSEDREMWLRLAVRYNFIAVPSVQILYRRSASSASANFSKMEAGCLQVIERAFAQAPKSLQHLRKRSIANFYKNLSNRLLQDPLKGNRGLEAAKYFWRYVKNDPSPLGQVRFKLSLLFKIAAVTLLPFQRKQNPNN